MHSIHRDPINKARLEDGVEVVQKQHTKKEQEELWAKWTAMSEEQKTISDQVCKVVCGKTNEEKHVECMDRFHVMENIVGEHVDVLLSEEERDKVVGVLEGMYELVLDPTVNLEYEEKDLASLNGHKLVIPKPVSKSMIKDMAVRLTYVAKELKAKPAALAARKVLSLIGKEGVR